MTATGQKEREEMADTIAPIGAHTRLQRDREHGQLWLTCLDCGAQWHDDDAQEQVSDGDGSCDEQAAADEHATHWGYGSGMPGCLFDNGPHFCETQDDAIDAALWLLSETGNGTDLSEDERAAAVADLKRDGTHYLARPQDHGAALVQIWEEDGPCPDSDD